MKLKIKRIHPDAKLPTKAYESAGYDVYSIEDTKLESEIITPVKIGLCMEIPEGYVGLFWDKSGRGKQGVKVYGGVIDADYRGEVEVLLGLNNRFISGGTTMLLPKGSKVAQILIQKVENLEVEEVTELNDTIRGNKGFGSSGLEYMS